MNIRPLLVSLVVVVALGAAAADVYRWVDDQGQVHYGPTPPPDAKTPTKVAVKTEANTMASNDGGAAAEGGDAAAVDAEKQALQQKKCDQAKAQLAKYDGAPYLMTKDADGTPRRASAEEEAAERLRVKRDIAAYCGG